MYKKVVRRSIKKDKVIFLSINLMVVMTITLSVLALLSFFSGYQSFQTFKDETNLEDFQMQTITKLTEDEINDLEKEYNLTLDAVEKFVYVNDGKQITIYEYDNEQTVSVFKLLEGEENLDDGQIVLSDSYAKENNINVGDEIIIDDEKLDIIGLDLFAEDIYPVMQGAFFPENANIAIGFVNEETFNKITEGEVTTTIYRGKFDEGVTNKSEIYAEMEQNLQTQVIETNILNIATEPLKYTEQSNVSSILSYRTNFNIGMLELEYEFLSVIMMAMSILIGVITIVLSLFLFKSIVEKQRRDIGILRSFGIYKKQIIDEYTKIFTYAILIDAVIAVGLGVFSYAQLNNLFSQFFNFTDYPVNPIVVFAILGVIVIEAELLLFFVRYTAINKNLNTAILDMVKNVSSENTKVKPISLKFKKFETKIKYNILLRNRNKTLLLVYGIAFSTFLLVFAFSMIFAVKNMQSNIYGEDFSYGYEAVFSPGYEVDEDKYTDESIVYAFGEIDGENDSAVSLIGYDRNNQYININDDIELQDNEVYITTLLADTFKYEIGDTITIVNPRNPDEKYEFVVKEITDNKAEKKIYANINYLQSTFDVNDNYYNGYVGKGDSKEQIAQGDANMTYISTEDVIAGIGEYSTLINVVILYMAAFAFLISLIALNVVTSIIIKNNEKTISIMKVLGYKTKEINKFIISGYRPIVLVSFLIMFPLSAIGVKYYMKFVLSLIDGLNYPLVLKANIFVFLLSLIVVILSFEVALFLTRRKIDKISLATSLNIDE